MFATPDWDDDTPNIVEKLAKKVKAKKNRNETEQVRSKIKLEENAVQETKPLKKQKAKKQRTLSVFEIPEIRVPKGKRNSLEKGKLLNKDPVNKPKKTAKKLETGYIGKSIAKTGEEVFNKENNGLALSQNKKNPKLITEKLTSQPLTQNDVKTNHEKPKKKRKKNKLNAAKDRVQENKQSSVPLKRKLANNDEEIDYTDGKPDKLLMNIKKNKLSNTQDTEATEENEDYLFKEQINPTKGNKKINGLAPKTHMTKTEKQKEKLKQILKIEEKSHRNQITSKGAALRQKMLEKLKSAQFRFLNEKLYTTTGAEAQQLFTSDPAAFLTYHEGYQQQIRKWPVNPLDVIVKRIMKLPKSSLIADMGCGEAKLAQRLPAHTVRSFDLVASNERVEACDMSRTPLLASSVDAAVYCLALMGTCLQQYLLEANRVLKTGGILLIAEVESRFDNPDAFTKEVQKLGFKLQKLDKSQNVFFFMEFKKVQECGKKQRAQLSLKPCYYKKR